MIAIPEREGGQSTCIDSTEVTNAQYAAFVQAVGTTPSGQNPACLWNSSYQPASQDAAGGPCSYDPAAKADYPVACVNWCDAVDYCKWAGKSLCSTTAAGSWYRACSSGGQYAFPYGNTYQPGKCVDYSDYDASQPVGTAATCQSVDPAFAGVFDLLGNVAEWSANCAPDLHDSGTTECTVVGDGFTLAFASSPTQPTECTGFNSDPNNPSYAVALISNTDPGLGIRCCATP
ncbi:MAG: formylglycine-generating enzyme family protein [Polyangiaceae bacterium]